MLKIHRLYLLNILGIDEFEYDFQGKSAEITGGNRQGKTSTLRGIAAGVYGPVDGTIHDFTDEGRVLIEMEELSIDRVIGGDNRTREFVVKYLGERVKKAPQGYVEKLSRGLIFDPAEFYSKKPREQRDMLIAAMPMEVDEISIMEAAGELMGDRLQLATVREVIEKVSPRWDRHALVIVAELREWVKKRRSETSGKIEAKRGVIAGLEAVTPVPYDDVAHGDVKARLATIESAQQAAIKAQTALTSATLKRDSKARDIETTDREVLRLQTEFERIRQEIVKQQQKRNDQASEHETFAQECANATASVEAAQSSFDAEELASLAKRSAEFETARLRSDMFRENVTKVEEEREVLAVIEGVYAQEQAAFLFFQDVLPQQLVRQAELPIEGIEIDDDGLTIHGRPFSTLSKSERMTVALKIAERQTEGPGMKFILIDDVEMLDDESYAVLEERAKVGDIQYIWVKRTNGERQVRVIQ